jgi:hypothetical protein
VSADGSWTQSAILVPEDQGAFDSFGYAVSIYDSKIAVGSYGAQSPLSGTDEGAVYLFSGGGSQWSQYAKLFASDGQATECFGCTVSIFQNTIAVGAYYVSKAYVFSFNYSHPDSDWTQQAILTTDAMSDLGDSLSVYGNMLAAGAPLDVPSGQEQTGKH